MKRLVSSITVTMTVLVAGVLHFAGPAQAGTACDNYGICGGIVHYSPDDGYDAPFRIRCNFGDPSSERLVYEGQTSSCKDTDEVYVAYGDQIVCRSYGGERVGWYWGVRYDATGWHKITDDQTPTCVHQRD